MIKIEAHPEKKQKSMLKGLRHGFVGLGTLWAVTQLTVIPFNERKTQLLLTDGLVQFDTLPKPFGDLLERVQKMDTLVEAARVLMPYALPRALRGRISDDRAMRTVTALLTNTIMAIPEMWRMNARVDLYSQQLAAGQQLDLVPRSRFATDGTLLATVERVAPFIFYETALAALSEYIVKPYMDKTMKDNLTFVTTDEEFNAWSEFLSGLVLRCVTVPIERFVKQTLAGVEPQVPAIGAAAAAAEQETEGKRTTLLTVAVKAAGYTVPILAAPLLHLYAYRAVSSVFRG